MTSTTVKQKPQIDMESVRVSAEKLQHRFNQYAHRIGGKDTSGRLFDTDNTPTRTDAPLAKEA